MKEFIDRLLNWSGGSYVGLATLTMLGLAVAEYVSGSPFTVQGPKGVEVWVLHKAPEWFVGTVGLYTVILGLFVAKKPISSIADRLSKKADAPPTTPGG